MPKAILEFNLPEERPEYDLAIRGIDYSIALSEYANWLRGLHKYTDKETITIEEARARLFEVCEENGIEL